MNRESVHIQGQRWGARAWSARCTSESDVRRQFLMTLQRAIVARTMWLTAPPERRAFARGRFSDAIATLHQHRRWLNLTPAQRADKLKWAHSVLESYNRHRSNPALV